MQFIISFVLYIYIFVFYYFNTSYSVGKQLFTAWFVRISDELHVPLEVCGAVMKRELDYWQIIETNIKPCCWSNYRSYIENQKILEAFNRSVLEDKSEEISTENLKGWEYFRTYMYLVLEVPGSSRPALVRLRRHSFYK